MTAFSLFATFEMRGRELGAKGIFGWVKKMPWKDVRFLAPFIGMILFIPAGTADSTVILTFFGITYWLIPSITGRKLTAKMNKLGIVQTIFWSVGITIMSVAMHWQGLLGGPRRSPYSEYAGNADTASWGAYQI